jgi:hypothetical protein
MLSPGLLDDRCALIVCKCGMLTAPLRRSRADVGVLKRNIKYVAEVIARLVYPSIARTTKNATSADRWVDIVAQPNDIDATFVESWLNFVGTQVRSRFVCSGGV